MAKGWEKHRERQGALASFGKDLARRAKSKCELCEAAGVKLVPHELAPAPSEPDIEKCLLLCEECELQLREPKRFRPGEHWRCLARAVWSETPAVQVAAVRLLRRQAGGEAWARETLEGLFLDEEIEEWVTQAE